MFHQSLNALVLENKSRDVFGFNLYQATNATNQLELICSSPTSENRKYTDGRIYTTNSLVTRFLDWIEAGKPATPSFNEGLNAQRPLDAAYISDKEGRWITL